MMVADADWKLVQFEHGARPVPLDLRAEPQEPTGLGASPAQDGVRARIYAKLHAWARRQAQRQAQRQTMSTAEIVAKRTAADGLGVLIGVVDASQVPPEQTRHDRGRTAQHRGPRA